MFWNSWTFFVHAVACQHLLCHWSESKNRLKSRSARTRVQKLAALLVPGLSNAELGPAGLATGRWDGLLSNDGFHCWLRRWVPPALSFLGCLTRKEGYPCVHPNQAAVKTGSLIPALPLCRGNRLKVYRAALADSMVYRRNGRACAPRGLRSVAAPIVWGEEGFQSLIDMRL